MEVTDNTSQNLSITDSQQETTNGNTSNVFWCAVCDYELDTKHICWNTDYEGTGTNCPMYGRKQA